MKYKRKKAKDILLAIGDQLRVARQLQGFTQSTLAEALGVSPSLVCRYEEGLVDITLSKMLEWCSICGYPSVNIINSINYHKRGQENQR